jgi:hypothetical protein
MAVIMRRGFGKAAVTVVLLLQLETPDPARLAGGSPPAIDKDDGT